MVAGEPVWALATRFPVQGAWTEEEYLAFEAEHPRLELSDGYIEVLPAGGINRFTAADIVARTGCGQIHAGMRTARRDPSVAGKPHVSFGGPIRPPEDRFDATSPDAVSELRSLLGG